MPTSHAAWAEFYQDGGVIMHFILGTAIVGLALVIERCWRLYVGQRVDARRLMALVQSRLLAGDTAGALRLCSSGRSYVRRIIRAGLMAGVSPERAEAAVHEVHLELQPVVNRWLPALCTIANLAMVMGLLGTVLGLIDGFHCGGFVSADRRAAAIAKNISIAVHTSGFGILVGIVLLSARLWLQSTSERLSAAMALCAARIVNIIRVVQTPQAPTGLPYR